MYAYKLVTLSTEQIEEKLDLLMEENKFLKEIIINLNDKFEALAKNLNTYSLTKQVPFCLKLSVVIIM